MAVIIVKGEKERGNGSAVMSRAERRVWPQHFLPVLNMDLAQIFTET